MPNKINYQKEMDELLSGLRDSQIRPKLLLHACCAPCSSYVLEYLSDCFELTVFYSNSNIEPESEYRFRVSECKRLISEMGLTEKIDFWEGRYAPEEYHKRVKGLENEPEGGARCEKCFRMRLEESAKAAAGKFDYFTTTLTISPLKNAELLNQIGKEIGEKYGIAYLPSDFKKKNGYKRSIELSAKYDLYRQNFCGCIYSKNERNV